MLMIVLVISFLAALTVYFVNSFITTERDSVVYSTMEEPELPVVYAIVEGMEINPMKGYYQEMGNEAADTVTILPEDRKLAIRIRKYGASVAGISYEIRNLSLDHFIERTKLESFDQTKDFAETKLPIQNLIEKDTEYLLRITLDTGEEKVNYYTRILWGDSANAVKMLQTARDFTEKTFNYEAARELTTYLETDPEVDNSDLGLVTIGSSFTQLTWGNTGMRMSSEPQLYLRSCSGIMGAVEVCYRTKMTDPAGEEEFTNVDEFTMRTGSERMYIMSYHRNTYEIFSGSKHRFAGKKIMLGITGSDVLTTAESPNGQYLVFKTDKELWSYDQVSQEAVNIFSFRSRKEDDIRAGWRDHEIKTLSVDDDGSVDFVVYGYMNRGRHEGYNGLVYYSYSAATGSTTERFFAPFPRAFEKLDLELRQLCAKGGSEMFFFKQNDTVIAVDLKSLEMMEVVSGLKDGTCLSDPAQTRFAWVENGKYDSSVVKVMNITTGATQAIESENGDSLLLLCFCGSDLLLGEARGTDRWMIGKRVRSLPFYRIVIYDENLSRVMEYRKQDLYIDDFVQDSNRFLFNLYAKERTGSYTAAGSDTIVCAEEDPYSDQKRVGRTTSGDKQTVYYVAIDNEIKNTKKLKIQAPDSVSYENSGSIEIRAEEDPAGVEFIAWANGHIRGISSGFREALDMCYDDMGWITDRNGAIVYNRTDRTNYYSVKDPFTLAQPLIREMEDFSGNRLTEEGCLLIDAYGIGLNQALGFVYKDCPVVWTDSKGEYLLLYGYDAKTVRLYYPARGDMPPETKILSRQEAENLFMSSGGNFLCFRRIGKG